MLAVDIIADPQHWLHSADTLSLAAWYATPLSELQARDLQLQARQLLQRQMLSGSAALAPRLADLIAGFWLGRDVSHDHRSLMATLPVPQRALVELIYGQLLMACKRNAAQQHLTRGFELATELLEPAAYFVLLRRHAQLRELVLSPAGSPPQALPELLLEARVIQRLKRGRGSRLPITSHDDTLG